MFTGSMAINYEMNLAPLLFEPFAKDLAARVGSAESCLELACGTGRLTRHLRPICDHLVATDLSEDMLRIASRLDPGNYRLADASSLPFDDASFDVVACQFGIMFFPNLDQTLHEARRVLRPGGRLLFSSWAAVRRNPWAYVIGACFEARFGDVESPGPSPFGCSDPDALTSQLRDAGFVYPRIESVTLPLIADSAEQYARATVSGSPLGSRLALAGVADVEPFIAELTECLKREFGDHPFETEMTALVASTSKPA
jgi:SAM-dependent methyltransferase